MIIEDIYQQANDEWQTLIQSISDLSAAGPAPGLGRRMSPYALYAELEDVRLSWRELLDAAWIKQSGKRYITAEWSVHNLIAHVASWASEITSQAETALAGRAFQYSIPFALSVIGPNEWNHQQVEKRCGNSVEELIGEIESATQRLQDIVLTTPEKCLLQMSEFPMSPSGDPQVRWMGNIAGLVILRCSHDRYHMERTRQFKDMMSRAE